MTLLPGDYGLTQIGGDVGKAIRFGQWLDGTGFSNYEHAFVYVGHGQIVEAEPGGARTGSVSEYSDILWSSGHFPLLAAQRTRIVNRAVQFAVGKTPYSAADYFALAAHRLHLPVPGLQEYISDTGHTICSQLVDICYQSAGYRLFTDGRWNGYVTPGDLYDLLVLESS
jgi:hypothetical protein